MTGENTQPPTSPDPTSQNLQGPQAGKSGKSGKSEKLNKPKRSRLARFGRFLLWTLLALVLLIAIILGLLYFLAGTDSGFARLTTLANDRVAGLNIEGSTGNLREGFDAASVGFANDSIDIKASGLATGWRLGCLMQRRFCLDDLHIEELDVTTFATEQPLPEPERTGPIDLPDIALPIDVILSDVSIGRLKFQPPGDAPAQVVNDIRLSAHTENSVATIENVSLGYQQFNAKMDGTIELQGQYPLDLSLNVNADDVLPDSVPEGVGKQPLQLDVALSDSLANLRVDAKVSGVASVDITANVQPLEQNLPATLSIVSQKLGWPVETHYLVQAGDTRIDVTGDMSDYDVSLKTRISGEQVPATDVSLSGLVNLDRVTVPFIEISTLGGQLTGSALASLAQPINWSTDWNIKDIDPSKQVADLQGKLNGDITASGSVNDGQWSLKLEKAEIDGNLRGLPFLLDAKLSKGLNDVWSIDRVTLFNDRNQIKAQGTVDDELNLNADINLTQLQNFMPGLAGGFDAKLAVSGPLQSPNISLDANADVLKFNDILVQALSIKGDIDKLFVDDSALTITVDSVRMGANAVTNTALSLTGTRLDHILELKANGPQQTAIDLALGGSLEESLNWSGSLDKVEAELPAHQVTLAEPAAINWENATQRVRVSPHCWSISDDASLCLQNEFDTGSDGQANITLDNYSLRQLNTFLPRGTNVSGVLSAEVALSPGNGNADEQRAVVSTTIDQASVRTLDALGESVSFSYDTISLDADIKRDAAAAALALKSKTLGNADVEIQFDPSRPDSDIDGQVQLQGLNLDIAQAFLPDFDKVGGTISAQGSLTGTLTAPEYNGNVVLDSPVLLGEILPLPLTGGRIVARIAGQSLSLDGQIMSDEGRIEIAGRGTLDPKSWNAAINLKGKQLNIQSDPLQESIINHDIRIEANARRIYVSGDIDIPKAVIDVEELPQGAATVSSDVVIIEEEEENAVPLAAKSNLNLVVALNVVLGDDVTVSAYGLNANLTGDMDVKVRGGRPPQLGGEITVVEGIFKKYGQDLEANGQILFVGPIESTRLDIDAVREIDGEDRTAGLRIQGTIMAPEITLFTDPADKSQDAILSYVVLGRDINEASDQEADLLATAALALAIKGGKSVGDGIASKLGVEEFGLETRGSGNDTELVVSGRLNDRLLLRYGRGVFDAESTLYLRYDLTKKLYLEAAQGAQKAVDLFYSFSF